MKRLIHFAIACCFSLVAFAANPSFQSFNTNQFDVTANRVAIKDGASVTNLVIFGTTTNLLEVWDSNNVLKFWIDTNGFSHPDLWTNNAGTIQASSTVADGASAVGLSVNTSNYIANTLAKLLLLQNFGTNRFYVSSEGYANSFGGGYYVEAIDDPNNYAYIQPGDFSFYDGGGARMSFQPSSTASQVSYLFDTSVAHSSGNLLEVKNNGTNKFVVPFDGSVQIPGDATANSLTITNDLNVHGSIKVNTMVVTNNVQFYNNTYVSNIYVTNILTAAGSSVFNTFTAESGTVSNNFTVLGNYVGTIDPAQTGTTLKQIKSLKLQFPRLIDGAGCTYANTNDYTALTFMLPQFSGTAATNANYCDFAFRVPTDLDTTVDLTASLTIRLTAADTAAHTYDVGMLSIANSGAAAGTPANYVALTVSGDGSGASGDIEGVSAVTLTSWKSNLTAGQWCLLRLNRDGANDASTVASNLMELEIFYTSTQ